MEGKCDRIMKRPLTKLLTFRETLSFLDWIQAKRSSRENANKCRHACEMFLNNYRYIRFLSIQYSDEPGNQRTCSTKQPSGWCDCTISSRGSRQTIDWPILSYFKRHQIDPRCIETSRRRYYRSIVRKPFCERRRIHISYSNMQSKLYISDG